MSAPTDERPDLDRRTFRILFWGVVAVAAALRIGYVLFAKRGEPVVGDQIYYSWQAVVLANGDWFADPALPGRYAADHPPITALALAPVSWDDANPYLAQRMLVALYGTAVVAGIGLLVRTLSTRRAALAGTAIAALYANLWMNDGLIMSETFAAGVVVLVLLTVYAYHRRRGRGRAALVGVAVGLAGLVRAELLLLGPLLGVPLMLGPRRPDLRRALAHLLLAGVAAATVIAPWVVRNQLRFAEPTFLSTQDGLTLLGANCPESYGGPGKGFWILQCADRVEVPADADQSERSSIYREEAFAFIGDHVSSVPSVVAARIGRGLSVWQVDGTVFLNTGEGREDWASWIGVWQYWILAPIAVFGIWTWGARGPRWPLLVTAGTVVFVLAAVYGIPRFRVPAEIVIVVGAAVAVERTSTWVTARRSPTPRAGRAAAPSTPTPSPHPRA